MSGRPKALTLNITASLVFILISLSLPIAADDTTSVLYFLSATPSTIRPTPVQSSLFRFDRATSSLVVVRQVVDGEVGTGFVESSQDRRIIVLASPALQMTSLAIVDMNAPMVERVVPVRLSYTPERGVIRGYLLDIPVKGLYAALFLADPDPKQRLVGLPLDTGTRGTTSPEILSFANIRYFRSDGAYGGGEGGRAVVVRATANGELIGDIMAIQPEPLALHLPPQVKPEPQEDLWLFVNTTDIAVLGRGHTPESRPIEPGVMYVLNKRLQTWRAVKIPGTIPWVRGFGSWVAGIAAEPDRDGARESPGKLRRMATVLKKGSRQDLTVDNLYHSSSTYFPGELFLYNAETARTYSIHTGEGDSEVLLVADGLVYYRVNDSLYKVAVGPNGLSEPVRLLTDENLSGIHWAFLGPAAAASTGP